MLTGRVTRTGVKVSACRALFADCRRRAVVPGLDDDANKFLDYTTKGGFHVVRIDGYSRTFNKNCGSPRFESGPFRAGGHTWRIGYYPKGTYMSNKDFISLYLFLADEVVAGPVNAEFKFSILDPYLEPLELPLHDTTPDADPAMATFSAPGSSNGYERFVRREELGELLKFGKYDCFSVRVDLRIVKEETSTVPPSSDMHQHHHLGELILSIREHSDVEFRVGEETFAAHRLLLEARSPVFKALLGLNETSPVMQIDDMEPRVFKAMLTFIYTDRWPQIESEDESVISQSLLVVADQYGLQRLKSMCESRLCHLVDANSAEDILYLAEKHQCAALKEACFDFIGSTATLVPAREKLLAARRRNQELRFDRLVSLCPTIITKDQISNVLENDWSCNSEGIAIALDIE